MSIMKSPPVYVNGVVKLITGPNAFGVPPAVKEFAVNVSPPLRTCVKEPTMFEANVVERADGATP